MESPPLTPMRHDIPGVSIPPKQRRPLARRSSSFSSTKSPVTRRPSHPTHRLSNASRYSNGTDDFASPVAQHEVGGGGMGTLADELDFAEDDWDEEGGDSEEDEHEVTEEMNVDDSIDLENVELGQSTPLWQQLRDPPQTDGARDSGIDVGYPFSSPPSHDKPDSRRTRKPSFTRRPSALSRKASSRHEQEVVEDKFSLELEEAMNDIARLADPANNVQADTMSRTVSALQDLSAQTTIETQSHRLTTSMNSLSAHLLDEAKSLQSLSSTLFSPFSLSSPITNIDTDSLSALITQLLTQLPVPDIRALQTLSRLSKETTELTRILSGLLDSLQVGKQVAAGAARHLRATQAMATELRRERERADEARVWIEREEWEARLRERWCAGQCRDVVGGFERVCEGLRKEIEGAVVG